jgi:uracil-DNA glycosylase
MRGKAADLEKLYEAIRQDRHYRTTRMGETFVPGIGYTEDAPIVLVGEAPGKQEEKQRRPFMGAAGKNLETLLTGIGLSRNEVFITNLVKFRPTGKNDGNRCPSIGESKNALPYLLDELRILAPRVVVCLGLCSAKALLVEPMLKMDAANAQVFKKHGFEILITYHPSPNNYMITERRKGMEKAFQNLKDRYL